MPKLKQPKPEAPKGAHAKRVAKTKTLDQAIDAKAQARVEAVVAKPDLAAKGIALALAELADQKGMHVPDLLGFPEILREAGLPEKVERWVGLLAHQLNRNMVDGMLFRANWRPAPVVHPAVPDPQIPEMTSTEAAAAIEEHNRPKVKALERSIKRHDKEASASRVESLKEQAEGNGHTPRRVQARTELFGFPGTAVIRWLGKQGVAFPKAKAILDKHGLGEMSESTIKIQLRAGLKGERGEPAKLTKDQAKQLLS